MNVRAMLAIVSASDAILKYTNDAVIPRLGKNLSVRPQIRPAHQNLNFAGLKSLF